jgi:hypothetical protein
MEMKQYVDRSMTFTEYVDLLDELFEKGLTTGSKQGEEMLAYAGLNRQRMKRIEKTAVLNTETIDTLKAVDQKMIWLIITEGWCGDAAQNIPVIEKIAAENINIETRYILRDENPELIDQFLTNGARSIPKLIALDAETFEVFGTWGARPFLAQDLYNEMKAQGLEKPLMMENLQRWYNADKNQSIQAEFVELVKKWKQTKEAAATAK